MCEKSNDDGTASPQDTDDPPQKEMQRVAPVNRHSSAELAAALAEMERLRRENMALRSDKAMREEAQARLQSDNKDLWAKVRDNRHRVDELSKQLRNLQELQERPRPTGAKELKAANGNALSVSTALGSSPAQSLSSHATPPSAGSLLAVLAPAQVCASGDTAEPPRPGVWPGTGARDEEEELPLGAEAATAMYEAPPDALTETSMSVPSFTPKSIASPSAGCPPCTAAQAPHGPHDGPEVDSMPGWPQSVSAAPSCASQRPRVMFSNNENASSLADGRNMVSLCASIKNQPLANQLANLQAQMAAVEAQGESLRAATRAVEDEYRKIVSSNPWQN